MSSDEIREFSRQEQKVVVQDQAAIAQTLAELGMATDRAILLAPFVELVLRAMVDLAKMQQSGTQAHQRDLLRIYEDTKRRAYAAERAGGILPCLCSPASALAEAERTATNEYAKLLDLHGQVNERQMATLLGLGRSLIQSMLEAAGERRVGAADVVSRFLPEASAHRAGQHAR